MKTPSKTISLLRWEGGFVNPIQVHNGPQGGGYMISEVVNMIPAHHDRDDIEVVIYEIKEVKRYIISTLKINYFIYPLCCWVLTNYCSPNPLD